MIEVCEIRSIVRSSASTLCSVELSISFTFFERLWSALSAIWFSWLIRDGQSMSGSALAGAAAGGAGARRWAPRAPWGAGAGEGWGGAGRETGAGPHGVLAPHSSGLTG